MSIYVWRLWKFIEMLELGCRQNYFNVFGRRSCARLQHVPFIFENHVKILPNVILLVAFMDKLLTSHGFVNYCHFGDE